MSYTITLTHPTLPPVDLTADTDTKEDAEQLVGYYLSNKDEGSLLEDLPEGYDVNSITEKI